MAGPRTGEKARALSGLAVPLAIEEYGSPRKAYKARTISHLDSGPRTCDLRFSMLTPSFALPPHRASSQGSLMCRNIRTLFNFEPPATDDEVRAASLQFVRKISGFTKPSKANEAAFEAAVAAIAAISKQLLDSLESSATPKN